MAVRWYLRYAYRDVEDLLAERGIQVDHATAFRWVQRFTPLQVDPAGTPRRWLVHRRNLMGEPGYRCLNPEGWTGRCG